MAACGSLQHIFEKPLPESPTLLESLSSWNQIKPVKPIEQPSFTEIFGELHFKENSESSSSSSFHHSFPISLSSPSLIDLNPPTGNDIVSDNKSPSAAACVLSTHKNKYTNFHKRSESFSSLNSDSLQLCTEGLGFESSDDVEDLKSEMNADWENQNEKVGVKKKLFSHHSFAECRRSRTTGVEFPPPISSIGQGGKPWVCFKAYRHDGRFVLKEIRVPTQEFLHAYREDGRLKLHFIQPNDGIQEEEEEEEEEEDDVESMDEEEENEDWVANGGNEGKKV
ncbi:Protein FANTASTIC FOUR like [Quillaja saponaria]|uniref:Protein FANTASTIC FOUR like n=1 Tax=Quillaja saponaria TaxID=32244 RepID=A0AAD7KY20_QUISA|nr:Protein FANTASTIC FOUR like [Quillaja saponaria]